jgi:hypothetical protein
MTPKSWKEAPMYVVNVPDAGEMICLCEGWNNHWVKFHPDRFAGTDQSRCSAVGCSGAFKHGGLVKKAGVPGLTDRAVYIIPLCDACHAPENTGPYLIHSHIALIPADPKVTCDRR